VLLLVEVADSSSRLDRQIELPLYARSGVGEVWIVDLKQRVLEAYK
jgi:Uma2 family endonuclease